MTVKEYIKYTHKMPLVLDDVLEQSEDKVKVTQAATHKKVKTIEFNDWIENIEIESIDYNADPKPNTAIHGPQGQKNEYDGNSFDSLWEAAYYIWRKEIKGEYIERNKEEYLYYFIDGQKKKFYPDFKCAEGFIEIKGIFRPNDLEKQSQNPIVTFLDGNDIKPILVELKKVKPNWKDNLIFKN